MPKHICRSRYICRIGILAVAILVGFAAQSTPEHLILAEGHEQGPYHHCTT